MPRHRYTNGTDIFRQDISNKSVFRVVTGCVRIETQSDENATKSTTLRSGDIFGNADFLNGAQGPVGAITVGMTEVDSIALVDLFAAIDEPAFQQLILDAFDIVSRSEITDAFTELGDDHKVTSLILIPADPALEECMTSRALDPERLPYVVGRKFRPNNRGGPKIHLALPDYRPYNLSRQHFSIERREEIFVVRDCGSYHGTLVNGNRIGGDNPICIADLSYGQNEIVAGPAKSSFRFVLHIS